MRLFLTLLCGTLLAAGNDSMLQRAEELCRQFNVEKIATPQRQRAPSVWLTVDLSRIQSPPFESLGETALWDHLQDLGVEGVWLKNLKTGGKCRTAIGIDPRWGTSWARLASCLQNKQMGFICDGMSPTTGCGPDFLKALRNEGDYPGMYRLVEIAQSDWKLLPAKASSLSWLQAQTLREKGYIPRGGKWTVTGKVAGTDGKVRRWVYRRGKGADPMMNFLNPTFAACRIATADTLDSIFNAGANLMAFDATLPQNARETLYLWTKKLGALSVLNNANGIDEMNTAEADLVVDTLTQGPLLQALVLQDATVLQMAYAMILQEGVDLRRLVHNLPSFDPALYTALPKPELMKVREQKWEAYNLRKQELPFKQPVALPEAEALRRYAPILESELLLSFFYAMQPGVFAFSSDDLLGALSPMPLNLATTNQHTLYASLPGQLGNSLSFASQLRNFLAIRKAHALHLMEFAAVPATKNFTLLFRKPNTREYVLLAVNFTNEPVTERLDLAVFQNATAVDLVTSVTEAKPFDASSYLLSLPGKTAKAILFSPKVYD